MGIEKYSPADGAVVACLKLGDETRQAYAMTAEWADLTLNDYGRCVERVVLFEIDATLLAFSRLHALLEVSE